MYKKEFIQKYLQPRKIPAAVLLYGDSFLIDYYAKKTLESLNCNDDELSKYYFDEYNYKALHEDIISPSLFTPRMIYLVKINKKIPKKDLESLLKYKSKQAILIICFYQGSDASSYNQDCREMDNNFRGGASVRFFAPNDNEGMQLMREMAQDLKLDIDNSMLLDIFNNQNKDFYLIQSDLIKLTTLGRKITKKDISEQLFGVATWNLNELCLSLFDKKDCLTIAANLLQSGSSGREIIVGMESFFMRFFLVFCYNRLHGRMDFSEILGYTPPPLIQQQFGLALRLNDRQYRHIFEILQSAFLGILQRGADSEREIFSALIKLKGIFR